MNMTYSNNQKMASGDYNPEGYSFSIPLVEKLLFSAPEYFVCETRIGEWFVLRLQKLLDLLNREHMTNVHSNNGHSMRIIEIVSDYASSMLDWFNSIFLVRDEK